MALTWELTPEQEAKLKKGAERAGLDVQTLLSDALTRAIDYAETVASLKEAIADMEAGNVVTMAQARERGQQMIEWARTLPREEFLAKMRERDGFEYRG